jgi:hypothetical protein
MLYKIKQNKVTMEKNTTTSFRINRLYNIELG